MKVKTAKVLMKVGSIVEGLAGPVLMGVGTLIKNKRLQKVGIGLLVFASLDLARTQPTTIDNSFELAGIDDDDSI